LRGQNPPEVSIRVPKIFKKKCDDR
jgi:hypothetical protein